MKKLVLPLLLFALCNHLHAQTIEAKLEAWNRANPIEKLYLHFDRDNYIAGQNIWFKGYFVSGMMPSGGSSTLYVELLDNASNVVLRSICPAYMGNALGQLSLPDDFTSGTYVVRAYTPIMLNQPGFNFYKRVAIFGKEAKKSKTDPTPNTPTIRFFPEGGNLILGQLNVVAFKIIDKEGLPLNTEGTIKDDKGELVTRFKAKHNGMGYFGIVPQAGKYTATLQGYSQPFALPDALADGIVFNVRNVSEGKQFKIMQQGNNSNFAPAYLLGQMGNEVLFKQSLKADSKEINGLIPTSELYSGVLHLTIFNKDNIPLAERLTFIDNKEYRLSATLNVDTLNTDARQKNRFSIALPDTIAGSFSIAITDADYDPTVRSQNIYASLLLNSDIKGYVHRPAYYFSSDADSVKNNLELVMMTNGWTRFKWTDLLQTPPPPPPFKDEGYIKLSGRINIEGSRKVLANKDIIIMISPADTTKGKGGLPRILRTDSLGRFKLDSVIFYDKMKILFSDVRGKKSKYISVKLDADSLNRKYNISPMQIPTDGTAVFDQAQMASAYADYLKAEGRVMENITVRGRHKSEKEKLDAEYATGLFSGGINSRTIDMRNEIYGGSFFQYLQGRIAGLTVTGTPGKYELQYRGGGTGNKVALYLDEIPVDADMLDATPVNQMAYVKFLPSTVAAIGAGAALAVYMKKGGDLNAVLESPTDIIHYNGYTIIKEFYNPNYDLQPDNDKPDNRLTLAWYPNIFISEINPEIPVIFYNNDRTKRFKVIAEGITSNGKMLMLERLLE